MTPLDLKAIRTEYESALALSGQSAYMADVAGYVPDLLAVIEQMAEALELVIREDFETGDVLAVCRVARDLVQKEPSDYDPEWIKVVRAQVGR